MYTSGNVRVGVSVGHLWIQTVVIFPYAFMLKGYSVLQVGIYWWDFIGRVRRIAESCHWLRHISLFFHLSVCPHGTTWLPLDIFS